MRHPEFVPSGSLSHDEMTAMQRDIASSAVFDGDPPLERALVAGVDQAFFDDRAVSAIVTMRDGEIESRVHAVTDLKLPYVPGLLAFREGGPILAAFEELDADPDLVLFDGSGRIHYRQAGLATHIGVVLDVPAVGVAKSLLCGEPDGSIDDLATGDRVPILANDQVDATNGIVIGYALQTRQYDSPDRSINPLYVSPGHRISAEAACDAVVAACDGYKLPEPVRLADQHAADVKRRTP